MKTLTLLLTYFFLANSLFSEVNAVYNDDKVEISWSNPLHIKVDYFVIERSKDGRYFKEILNVNASENNGSSIEYFEIDYNPFNKKAYYRIKQVDINGKNYYSNMVVAQNLNNVKPLFNVFSNNRNTKGLKDYKEKDILVVITNAHKEEFIARLDVVKQGKELVVTYANVKLPTGIYLVTATSDDRIYGRKININGNHSSSVYSLNIK